MSLSEVNDPAGLGRGMVSARDCGAGTELVALVDPLAHVSLAGAGCCDHCLVKDAVKQCSKCKAIAFCGRDCFASAWRGYHKHECAAIQRMTESDGAKVELIRRSVLLRLGLRCALKATDQQGGGLARLCSNRDRMTEAELAEIGATAALLHKCAAQGAQMRSVEEWVDLLCRLQDNVMVVSDDELRGKGLALYLAESAINHDCDPNCVAMFRGHRLTIRSIRPIRAGDQLHISYCDLSLPSQLRKKALRRSHHFECGCRRCTGEPGPMEASRSAEAVGCEKACETMLAQSRFNRVGECARVLGEQHHLVLQLHEACMASKLAEAAFQEALPHALALVEGYSKALPNPNHPLLPIKLAQLGKLQAHLGMDRAALDTLRQAASRAQASHGRGSALMQQIVECMAGLRPDR